MDFRVHGGPVEHAWENLVHEWHTTPIAACTTRQPRLGTGGASDHPGHLLSKPLAAEPARVLAQLAAVERE